MIEAGFYAYAPKPATVPWFPFGSFGARAAERAVHQRFASLENGVPGQGTVIPSPDAEASVKRSNRFIHTCGGIEVMPAVREVAPGSVRVTPAVYSTATAAVLLYGYLGNSGDLLNGSLGGRCSMDGNVSPRVAALRANPAASEGDAHLAAELLLELYQAHSSGASDLLIMMSQLQGAFAFCIWDDVRKQMFAARDPSGFEPLYYHFDEDEGINLTNQPFTVLGGPSVKQWHLLPPGHFIAGKHARVHQYALTPQQLHEREVWESTMDDKSPLSRPSLVGGLQSSAPSHSSADLSQHLNMFRISL